MSNNGSKWIRRARRVAIYRRDGFRCVYCEGRSGVLTLDHVRPLDRGGTHASRNLVTACGPCNSAKQHRAWEAFARSLEARGVCPVEARARVRRAVRRRVNVPAARELVRELRGMGPSREAA